VIFRQGVITFLATPDGVNAIGGIHELGKKNFAEGDSPRKTRELESMTRAMLLGESVGKKTVSGGRGRKGKPVLQKRERDNTRGRQVREIWGTNSVKTKDTGPMKEMVGRKWGQKLDKGGSRLSHAM